VDLALAVVIGVAAGMAATLLAVSVRRSRRSAGPVPPHQVADSAEQLARSSLDALRVGVIVLGNADSVVLANPAARRMGLVRDSQLVPVPLRGLARQVRRERDGLETELDLPRGRVAEPLAVRVRFISLDAAGHVIVQAEDVTEAHRVEDVRRDFVANVSHELKTPVGALTLLAEAVIDAVDDADAVRRFANRMLHESDRLARLVSELLELSRLQGAEPLPSPETVHVDDVVGEVVDRCRLTAEASRISVVAGGERGLTLAGSARQLTTALSNLVDNAIAYGAENSRVAIGTRLRDGMVEISVSDQGIGIAEKDLDRIFERFYRADPARSRATGGTGLGLAIVKHIATNHGGSVDVWSVEGSGSTFTLRLPAGSEDVPGPVVRAVSDTTVAVPSAAAGLGSGHP
jgi:two-component system sensor histidine kinase SenX3